MYVVSKDELPSQVDNIQLTQINCIGTQMVECFKRGTTFKASWRDSGLLDPLHLFLSFDNPLIEQQQGGTIRTDPLLWLIYWQETWVLHGCGCLNNYHGKKKLNQFKTPFIETNCGIWLNHLKCNTNQSFEIFFQEKARKTKFICLARHC